MLIFNQHILRKKRQLGIAYSIALLLSTLIGVGLLAAVQGVYITIQREKESQLLFVGNAIALAIKSYNSISPGLKKHYPKQLEDLLIDKRFIRWPPKRHLRKIYYDPITKSKNWGLIYDKEKNIRGVYSLSEKKPIKKDNFSTPYKSFKNKKKI